MLMFCSMLWALEWCWNREKKMVGVYSGCCYMSFSYLARVEQWGRTHILVQASSSRLGENISSSLRVLPRALAQRGAAFWATCQLAQARQRRLSERSWNLPGPTVVGSPKRELIAWARQLLSFGRWLLAWARLPQQVA